MAIAQHTGISFSDIKPKIGSVVHATKESLVWEHAAGRKSLVIGSSAHAILGMDALEVASCDEYPLDCGRRLHRTKLRGEEAVA